MESELASGLVEPLEIAVGKLLFGALLQPAHGNDSNTHDEFSVVFFVVAAHQARARRWGMRVSRSEIGSVSS